MSLRPAVSLFALGVSAMSFAACSSEAPVAPEPAAPLAPAAARGPALALSDSSIAFCYAPGTTRHCVFLSTALRVTAVGDRRLAWKVASNRPWLIVSPASGRTPACLRIAVDSRKAPRAPFPGVLFGAVTVSAVGAANSPLTIGVRLYQYPTRIVLPNKGGCPG